MRFEQKASRRSPEEHTTTLRALFAGCAVVCCLAPLLCGAGCTTLLMDGNGPMDYRQTKLASLSPLANAAQLTASGDVKHLAAGKSCFLNVGQSFGKAFSFRRVNEFLAGRREDGNVFLACRNYWFPLFLLDDIVTLYDANGAPLAVMSSFGFLDMVGLVYKRVSYTRAVDDRKHERFYTGFRTIWGLPKYIGDPQQARQRKYIEKEAWVVLLGVFGMGDVNGRRYMQLLWIPIPIGSSR